LFISILDLYFSTCSQDVCKGKIYVFVILFVIFKNRKHTKKQKPLETLINRRQSSLAQLVIASDC